MDSKEQDKIIKKAIKYMEKEYNNKQFLKKIQKNKLNTPTLKKLSPIERVITIMNHELDKHGIILGGKYVSSAGHDGRTWIVIGLTNNTYDLEVVYNDGKQNNRRTAYKLNDFKRSMTYVGNLKEGGKMKKSELRKLIKEEILKEKKHTQEEGNEIRNKAHTEMKKIFKTGIDMVTPTGRWAGGNYTNVIVNLKNGFKIDEKIIKQLSKLGYKIKYIDVESDSLCINLTR